MIPADEIDDHFQKDARPNQRWIFTPKWGTPLTGYRYALTYIAADRRYTLARQKIEPFKPVADDDLLAAFKEQLTPEELAECVRESLKPQRRDLDDDIPF